MLVRWRGILFLGKKKVSIDEKLLAEHIKYNVMKSEMEKCVVSLKNNYIKNLSLRSSTGIYNISHNYLYILNKKLL